MKVGEEFDQASLDFERQVTYDSQEIREGLPLVSFLSIGAIDLHIFGNRNCNLIGFWVFRFASPQWATKKIDRNCKTFIRQSSCCRVLR